MQNLVWTGQNSSVTISYLFSIRIHVIGGPPSIILEGLALVGIIRAHFLDWGSHEMQRQLFIFFKQDKKEEGVPSHTH